MYITDLSHTQTEAMMCIYMGIDDDHGGGRY